MSFLNPVLLGFAAAVAVPILIHLLNRRRFRRVSWAAMRFLQASLEKNRRRMELEEWLLLALRCLIVALLALALARPALRAAASFLGTGQATAVLLLDPSASLGAQDGTRPRFDLARQAAEAAVDAFPVGSALAVLLAADRVLEPIAEPTLDLNLVRKTVREAELTDLASDHVPAIRRAIEILGDQTALRKEIVLVTDRQALGWRRWADAADELGKVSRDTRLRVVFVGEPLDDNLAVAALRRSPGFASAREPLRYHAEIVNRGASPVRQVRATLHVDRGPAIDEAVVDVLGPGEAREVTLFARLPDPGYHAVTVRLPPDRLPADDERTAMVRGIDQAPILIVDGDPESNSAFFLRHALQPVPPDAAPGYLLQPRITTPAQMTGVRLGDYAAVLLADVPSLTGSAIESLSRYVRQGGALLLFLGTRTQPAFYNSELLERAGLLPASLGAVRGDPSGDTPAFTLESGGYAHPIFALWNESRGQSLAAVQFRAAWELTPAPARTNAATEAGPGQVMIRFSDGSPAAVERTVGDGRVLLFASTAGTAWNDLAVRPAFVPFLHRAVASVAATHEARLNVRTGARVQLRLPPEYTGREVAVLAPGTPERRFTRTMTSGPDGARLAFDETAHAGPYRVSAVGESTVQTAFATQSDPDESDLTPLGDDQRQEVERVAQVVEWSSGMDLRAAFDRERFGTEFWLPLALAVLLLAITETWLAQAFSRPR